MKGIQNIPYGRKGPVAALLTAISILSMLGNRQGEI